MGKSLGQSFTDRSDALDGLRAIAALLVAFYHCGADLRYPPLVIQGFTGVLVFFVLSGYLVSKPFVLALAKGESLPSLQSYAIRRFTRIYPPYFAALLFYTIMRYAMNTHPPTASNFSRTLFFISTSSAGTPFTASMRYSGAWSSRPSSI